MASFWTGFIHCHGVTIFDSKQAHAGWSTADCIDEIDYYWHG